MWDAVGDMGKWEPSPLYRCWESRLVEPLLETYLEIMGTKDVRNLCPSKPMLGDRPQRKTCTGPYGVKCKDIHDDTIVVVGNWNQLVAYH